MPKGIRRRSSAWSSLAPIVIGTLVVFAASATLTQIDRLMEVRSFWVLPALLGLVFCAYLLPLVVSLLSMLVSLQRRSPKELVIIIFGAYLGTILNFAMLYYMIVFSEDRNNELLKEIFYQYNGKTFDPYELRDAAKRGVDVYYHDERSFAGIESKLWIGLDETINERHKREYYDKKPLDWVLLAQSDKGYKQVRQDKDARLEVALDCLHLSVITMTSVGYGDITPKTRSAKLATDAQALSGQFLIVVAFGMALSNWWKFKDPDEERDPVADGLTAVFKARSRTSGA